MGAKWDENDKGANTVLSNNDLTASTTVPGSDTAAGSVPIFMDPGKYCIEIELKDITGDVQVGLADKDLWNPNGLVGDFSRSMGLNKVGAYGKNSGLTLTALDPDGSAFTPWVVDDIVMICTDATDLGKTWFGMVTAPGVTSWYRNQLSEVPDPENGLGRMEQLGAATDYIFVWSSNNGQGTMQATVNGAVPVGFLFYQPDPPP